MRSNEELVALIEFAKAQGMRAIEIDGVKFTIPAQVNPTMEVPELKPEEIINPLSVLDDLDEDEIKYWATPYYDELVAKKEAKHQSIKDSEVK